MNKRSVFIAKSAIVLALCILANTFSINFGGPLGQFSFVYLTSMLAGCALGPFLGAGISGLADFIIAVIYPKGGAPLPLITLSIAMQAFIVGMIFKYVPLRFIFKIIISAILIYFICSALITPLALYRAFGKKSFAAWSISGLIKQPLWIAINTFLMTLLYKPLKSYFIKEKEHIKKEDSGELGFAQY